MLRAWSAKRVPWSKPAEYIVIKPIAARIATAKRSGESKPLHIGRVRCHSAGAEAGVLDDEGHRDLRVGERREGGVEGVVAVPLVDLASVVLLVGLDLD